ncbi:unnamed protein product [Phaeothamnion confervicola]
MATENDADTSIRPPQAPVDSAGALSTGVSARTRFEIELEFVQCLSRPNYLHCGKKYVLLPPCTSLPRQTLSKTVLAQNRYFDDPAFLAFLRYLSYWKRPEYAKFVTYPHCLGFLDILNDSENELFRKELAMEGFRDYVHQQQFFHWQHFHTTRYVEPMATPAPEPPPQAPPPVPGPGQPLAG